MTSLQEVGVPRTSSSTQSYPLIPIETIQDRRRKNLAQQVIHLLSQGVSHPSFDNVSEIIAIKNNQHEAFPPTNLVTSRASAPHHGIQYPASAILLADTANSRDLNLHSKIQHLPPSDTLPSFQSPFINPFLLSTFSPGGLTEAQPDMQQLLQSVNNSSLINNYHRPSYDTLLSFQSPFINPFLLPTFSPGGLTEAQPDMQQLIQSVNNSNLIKLYLDRLSSHENGIIQRETFTDRGAMLSRQVQESPITAYLLSRCIVQDSGGKQRTAITDPPHPPPLRPVHTLPRTLAQPEDRFTLSEFQVVLRQNIEVFQATQEEANVHVRGRNIAIYLHQVGIRCIHCKHVPMSRRKKGFMYFPSNTLRIYQAAQNMATAHMISGLCEEMPADIKDQFQTLVTKRSISGKAGRVFWAQSAETHLGLVNTPFGMGVAGAMALL